VLFRPFMDSTLHGPRSEWAVSTQKFVLVRLFVTADEAISIQQVFPVL
jgi:hypothetical protein